MAEREDFTHLETVKATIQKVECIEVGVLRIVGLPGDEHNPMQPVKIFFDGVEQENVRSIKLEGSASELWKVTMERFTFKKEVANA